MSAHNSYSNSGHSTQHGASRQSYDQGGSNAAHSSSRISAGASHSGNSYNAPRAPEVYHLPELANQNIPAEIREQFQRDEYGRVLFFTTPPLVTSRVAASAQTLGHSASYLADRARHGEELKRKRREAAEKRASEELQSLKRKHEEDAAAIDEIKRLRVRVLDRYGKMLAQDVKHLYEGMHGDDWQSALKAETDRLAAVQEESLRRNLLMQKHDRESEERKHVSLAKPTVFLDDVDPRY